MGIIEDDLVELQVVFVVVVSPTVTLAQVAAASTEAGGPLGHRTFFPIERQNHNTHMRH